MKEIVVKWIEIACDQEMVDILAKNGIPSVIRYYNPKFPRPKL